MNDSINVLNTLNYDEKKIFNLLQKNGSMTKNEILSLTKMKLTTLNRIMEPLEENKAIIKYSIGESTGGRKPILYNVNLCHFYIIGIDISPEYTEVVFTNLKMELIYKKIFPMDSTFTPYKTADTLLSLIHKATLELNLESLQLLGIGISTAGAFHAAEGTLKGQSNFFSDKWNNVNIKTLMENKLDYPVIIENGASAAVLAESIYGFKNCFKNIAYINCGFKIRTGTILSGTILKTADNREDAFGHMIVDIDGEECNCGNFGCIESSASTEALVKKIVSQIKRGSSSIINKPLNSITYKDICIAAEENDELSREVIKQSALVLGTGLSNYINLLDLKAVILSGPLIKKSNLFYSTCVETALKKLHFSKKQRVVFKRGGYFKEEAISIGAAAMVVEKHLEKNY